MGKREHLVIIKQGIKVWNKWRQENPGESPDLSGENLYEAELFSANLDAADLSKGNLQLADLNMANLRRACLREANLSMANLMTADLSGADLSGANLCQADLYCTNFSKAALTSAKLWSALVWGTKLTEANLSNAEVGETIFADVDLSVAKGLDVVRHTSPSTIGIDTIFRSKGDIPEVFLRGAGIPDSLIAYAVSLVGKPVGYYSCFISHSYKDRRFAERLYKDLQNAGARCWFAPEDMKAGDRIRDAIDRSIRLHDKLLLILSKASISSEWVRKEVETAFELEKRQGSVLLFPVRLDDAVMNTEEAWASDIRRTRHIGDFSSWKNPDFYKNSFARLLRDLAHV
jgi:hypothetical protein